MDAFLALCDRISVGDAVSQHPPSTSPPRRSSEYTDGSRRAENAHAPIPRRRRASAADAPIVRPPTLFCSDESPEAGEAGGTQEFLPPPPHLGLPAPNGAPAAAEVQQVFETLLDMFPGRHHADLFAIAGSSNSLEAAITSVIQTQVRMLNPLGSPSFSGLYNFALYICPLLYVSMSFASPAHCLRQSMGMHRRSRFRTPNCRRPRKKTAWSQKSLPTAASLCRRHRSSRTTHRQCCPTQSTVLPRSSHQRAQCGCVDRPPNGIPANECSRSCR